MPAIIAYAILGSVSFLLHVAWERMHIVLYTGYEALEGALPVYVFATVGDVAYTMLVAVALAFMKRDLGWIRKASGRDLATLAALGFMIAVFVEAKAQYLSRWEYTDAMPTVWGFGLSPLVQMTVLLPLSVWITMVVLRSWRRYNTSS